MAAPSPLSALSPTSKKPTEAVPKEGSAAPSCGNKLASLAGGKPSGAAGGFGKLAALMKKAPGAAPDAKNTASGGNNAAPAAAAGGGGGLMNMLLLKKKLTKWRTSKLKTWNMNESTTSTMKTQVENTYRLEPERQDRFLPAKVKACIEKVLQQRIKEDTRYNPGTFSMLSRLVADEIKEEVKGLGFTRYKLVVHVMLSQNLGQGLQTASRSVWDPTTDNSATLTFRSNNVCAVINVFGTYFE